MKFLNSKNKLRHASFIVLLVTTTLGFSQGTNGTTSSGYTLESCYHVVSPSNSNTTLNVLNVGEFHFNYTNNAGARPDHIRIKMYDAMHGFLGYNYHAIGIADNVFPVYYHPFFGQLITVAANDETNNNLIFNKNQIVFPPEAAIIEITTYHWTGDAGSQTLDESTYMLNLNLLDVDDAFTLDPWSDDCFTFDNFKMRYSHILDNFCGTMSNPILSLLPPPPTGSGWNINFSQQLNFNTLTSINQPMWQGGISWCDDECTNVTAPHHVNNPVPCGCVDFEVNVTLNPCPTAPAHCQPKNFILPIKICCDCDVRETGPQN